MRTETITIYSYFELSEEAKATAYNELEFYENGICVRHR